MQRKTYAVFINSTDSQFHTDILSGITDYAGEKDVNLLIYSGEELKSVFTVRRSRNIIYNFVDKTKVDGILFFSYLITGRVDREELIQFCEKYAPIPVISIGLDLRPIPSIVIDNYRAIKQLVTHLTTQHGYKKFAFIRCNPTSMDGMMRHYEFIKVLEEHGIFVGDEMIVQGEYGIHTGIEGIKILMDKRKVDFEVVIAANDDTAIGAAYALKKRNKKVPEDVAVIGYDNTFWGINNIPPLTTIRQPIYEMGRMAVDMICSLQDKGKPVTGLRKISSELILRESCGCKRELSSRNISDAAVGDSGGLESFTEGKKDAVILDLVDDIQKNIEFHSGDLGTYLHQVIHSFMLSVSQEEYAGFQKTYKEFMRVYIEKGMSKNVFEEIIRFFHKYFIRLYSDRRKIIHTSDFTLQAFKDIEDFYHEEQFNDIISIQNMGFKLKDIYESIQFSKDLSRCREVLSVWLPMSDIHTCYISLYEGSRTSTEYSRLFFGLQDTHLLQIKKDWGLFRSAGLIPEHLRFPEKDRFIYLVLPLTYGEYQIGFFLLNFVSWTPSFYELLRRELSIAMLIVLYREKMNTILKELVTQRELSVIETEDGTAGDKQLTDSDNPIIASFEFLREKMEYEDLRIQKAINYIDQKYNTDLSLEEVAEELNVEASYFSRIFKQVIGTGFVDYLRSLRVKKATMLLRNKYIKVKDIALMVGYKDSNYFCQVMKKETGYSPGNYRDLLLNGEEPDN
ncbi:MAG: substrate-binding domain-containing protein [Spirochaetales bacterium]|nr:substrate-binding domain-containing protein [Spirochaetales bacterium]